MIRARVGLALAAALAGGCLHRHPDEKNTREAPRPEQPDRPEARGIPPRAGHPRVPASPEGLLAPGAIGEIQDALRHRGYLERARRGELDDATTAAVRKFQDHEGLASTGMPDRETLRRLGIDPEKTYGREKRGDDE